MRWNRRPKQIDRIAMPEFVTMLDSLESTPPPAVEPVDDFETEGAGLSTLRSRTIVAAVRRGFVCRCPKCGGAKLFRSFLQPVDACHECGQDWRIRTADDFPPYLVILFVGHIVAPGMIGMESGWHPPLWVHLSVWLPLVLLLSLLLIQPMKGVVIAFQWWNWDRTTTLDAEAD